MCKKINGLKNLQKILNEYDQEKNKCKLAMAMFEGAVVKDAGNMLCTSCYTLEGDSSLISTAHDMFKGIDKYSSNGFDMPLLKKGSRKYCRCSSRGVCTFAEQ